MMDVVVGFCHLSVLRLRQKYHQYFEVSLDYRVSYGLDRTTMTRCLEMKSIIIIS